MLYTSTRLSVCVYTVYTHIRFISLPLLNTNDIQEPCCHVLYEWVHGPVTPKWMVIFICRSGDFIVLKHLYIVRRILYIVLIAKICLTEPNIIKRPRHPLMLYIYIHYTYIAYIYILYIHIIYIYIHYTYIAYIYMYYIYIHIIDIYIYIIHIYIYTLWML